MMQALRFLGNRTAEVVEAAVPVPKKNEVLLRVKISALCGSERADYNLPNGPAYVPGHEYAGVLCSTGNSGLKPGQRVVVNCVKGCGNCYFCKSGQPQFCKNFIVYNGGHADYVCVDASCVLPIPDEMSFEEAVLLGGDTAGVAFRAVGQLRRELGNTVLVIGAGPVGLGVVSFLRYFGYRIIVVEQNAYRRDFVRAGFGLEDVLDADCSACNALVALRTNGLGVDAVIECTGCEAMQQYALSAVRCQGQVVLCGENYQKLELVPSRDIIHKEVRLSGAFYYTKEDFEKITELFYRGYRAEGLISHTFALQQAPQACALFFSGKTAKVLLTRQP